MVRYDDPYKVIKAHPETSSYTFALPPRIRIFPTFHASLLRLWLANDDTRFPSRQLTRPGPIIKDTGEEEWPVEKILNVRCCGRKYWYLVRWQGQGPEEDSWILASEARWLTVFEDWLKDNNPDSLPA